MVQVSTMLLICIIVYIFSGPGLRTARLHWRPLVANAASLVLRTQYLKFQPEQTSCKSGSMNSVQTLIINHMRITVLKNYFQSTTILYLITVIK